MSKIILFSMVVMVTIVNGYNVRNYRGECYNRESQNFTQYDTTSQMCCNGEVYQKNPHLFQACCGSSGPYAIETHICCGNEILPIDSELKCCNRQQSYNDSTHLCCGPSIHQRHGEEYVCCGEHFMNQRIQTCCPSGPRSYAPREGTGQCCGTDNVYRPQTQICCLVGYQGDSRVHSIRRSLRDDVECCGLDFYMTSAQLCCDGVSFNKSPHTACCGKQTFDTETQVCCNGEVSDIENGRTQCCGEAPYNPSIETCCYFTISPIANGKCCSDVAYHPSESSCCHDHIYSVPEIDGVQSCCGMVSYLETDQMCCNGMLRDQQKDMNCCGKEIYNTTTDLCCALNSVVQKKTSSTKCCGSGLFESDAETCCEQANKGFPGLDGKCCYQNNSTRGEGGVVVAYDPKKSTCCSQGNFGGVFHGTPEADSQCCGQYLLESTHICFNNRGRLYPVEKQNEEDDRVCPNGLTTITYNSESKVCTTQGTLMMKGETQEICGQRLYDTETQICCQGMVHSRYDEEDHPRLCCQPSVHAYTPSHQSCCAGRVNEHIPSIEAGCCGNTPYDTRTDACDQSNRVRPISEVQRYPNMCGSTPYHPEEHSCCQGVQLVGDGQTCCGGYVFNTSTPGVNTGECCGPIGYNSHSHVCCGGNPRPKLHLGDMCCGEVLWDPSSLDDICCDGVLQPIQSTFGDRLNCSGQLAFSDRETICGGVRFNVPHGHCCGMGLFDPETEICCNDSVYPKSQADLQCCGNLPFIPSDPDTLCCNNSTLHYNAAGKECCGNHAMDINHKNCCTRSDHPYIYKKNRHVHTCCSSNTDTDTCCNGNLHLNIKDGICCGSAILRHPDREMCCGGRKVLKEFGIHSTCCGQNVIDSRVFSCCNGRQIRKGFQGCCNNRPYSTYYQNCCGSHLYYKFDPHALCCNSTLHNASIYGCCNGETYVRGKYECCDGNIYDASNQICQDGKVGIRERRQTTENPLCNGAQYNDELEGCCGGRTIYNKGKLGCCNEEIYNPMSEVCCGDKISVKRNGACCGPENQPYNTHKSICCNGTLRGKSNGAHCCGRKNYHNETQMCCLNKVYLRTPNTQCCGNQIFSPKLEVCCRNSSIVGSVSSYFLPSCYSKMTVSDATVWVQKKFGRSKVKSHKRKQLV